MASRVNVSDVLSLTGRRHREHTSAPPSFARAPIAASGSANTEFRFQLEDAQRARALGRTLSDGMVMTGTTERRMVLFTFDDGPDPRTTPRLLDLLDEAGVRAVFFINSARLEGPGDFAARAKALVQEIAVRGHVLGNHTANHAQLPLLTDAEIVAELDAVDEWLTHLVGGRSWLVRPPGGGRSQRVDALLAGQGYTTMLWNLGTGDYQVGSSDEVVDIFRRVFERRERENGDRGGIVLLHDTHAWSVDAFPKIMEWLARQNCKHLQGGEELYDVVDDPSYFFVPRGDHDPSEIAPMAEMPQSVFEARQARIRERVRATCSD